MTEIQMTKGDLSFEFSAWYLELQLEIASSLPLLAMTRKKDECH